MSRIHPVFPVIKLELAPPDPIAGRIPPPPPPPDLIDGHAEFEVEEIVNSRVFRGNIQFKIWYKGHPRTSAEWVPATDAENAQDKVRKFFDKNPKAPGREEWFTEYPPDQVQQVVHRLPKQSFAELWYQHGRADSDADWRNRSPRTSLPRRGVM
jgi:hypothetical protein